MPLPSLALPDSLAASSVVHVIKKPCENTHNHHPRVTLLPSSRTPGTWAPSMSPQGTQVCSPPRSPPFPQPRRCLRLSGRSQQIGLKLVPGAPARVPVHSSALHASFGLSRLLSLQVSSAWAPSRPDCPPAGLEPWRSPPLRGLRAVVLYEEPPHTPLSKNKFGVTIGGAQCLRLALRSGILTVLRGPSATPGFVRTQAGRVHGGLSTQCSLAPPVIREHANPPWGREGPPQPRG